jgi:hypothetical protein
LEQKAEKIDLNPQIVKPYSTNYVTDALNFNGKTYLIDGSYYDVDANIDYLPIYMIS